MVVVYGSGGGIWHRLVVVYGYGLVVVYGYGYGFRAVADKQWW